MWHVVQGDATAHPVAISTSISMAVVLESHVDPLAIIENAFTAGRAAVGVVIEQASRKGAVASKTSNDVEIGRPLDMVLRLL